MPTSFDRAEKKKPKTIFWLSMGTLLTLSLVNCGGGSLKDNRNSANTPPTTQPTPLPIQKENALANIQVIVKSSSGNLVPQASVQIYDVTEKKVASAGFSDEAGAYNAVGIDRYSDYSIKIAHQDYALQVADIQAALSPSDLNTFTITLVPIGEKTTFNEDQGGIVPLTAKSRGVKITVPANAFVNTSGTAVEGLVDVEVTTIDMSSAQERGFFPGSFDAIDADGSNQHLYSYGVTHVDFYQNGKELKVAPNTQVAVEFPVFVTKKPNGEPVKAGDMIPLWWLDENTGVWIYETNAIVTTSTTSPSGWIAKGSVSHFTAYNVDDRYPTIDVSVECLSASHLGGGFEGGSAGGEAVNVPCCVSSKNVTPAFNPNEFNDGDRYKFTIGGHGSICSKEHTVHTSPAQYPVVPHSINGQGNIPGKTGIGANNTLCQITAIKKTLDKDETTEDTWKTEDLASQIFHACYPQGIDLLTHTIKAKYVFQQLEGANDWTMTHTYTVELRPTPFVIVSP